MLFDSLAPGTTIMQSQFGVLYKSSKRFGQRHCILGRNEQTRFAMNDGFRNPSQMGGYNRACSSHRFDDHGWKNIAGPLGVCHRRQRENIGSPESLQNGALRQRAEQVNPV